MIQFLIISDIPQFWLGNIRSRDALTPIARERKDLMDYNISYLTRARGIIVSYSWRIKKTFVAFRQPSTQSWLWVSPSCWSKSVPWEHVENMWNTCNTHVQNTSRIPLQSLCQRRSQGVSSSHVRDTGNEVFVSQHRSLNRKAQLLTIMNSLAGRQ